MVRSMHSKCLLQDRFGGAGKVYSAFKRTVSYHWHDDQEYTLYSERADAENSTYHNYRIHGAAQITIGRTDENDIQYALNCVSRKHTTLCWNKNRWVITDEHSLNGTFVNGQRIHQVPVFPGDVIYIAGLRIIMGFDFVSMNDRGRPVSLNPGVLRPVQSIEHRETKQMPAEEREQYFTPSPRKRLSMAFPTIPSNRRLCRHRTAICRCCCRWGARRSWAEAPCWQDSSLCCSAHSCSLC